jgi:hypothetical protein
VLSSTFVKVLNFDKGLSGFFLFLQELGLMLKTISKFKTSNKMLFSRCTLPEMNSKKIQVTIGEAFDQFSVFKNFKRNAKSETFG